MKFRRLAAGLMVCTAALFAGCPLDLASALGSSYSSYGSDGSYNSYGNYGTSGNYDYGSSGNYGSPSGNILDLKSGKARH